MEYAAKKARPRLIEPEFVPGTHNVPDPARRTKLPRFELTRLERQAYVAPINYNPLLRGHPWQNSRG